MENSTKYNKNKHLYTETNNGRTTNSTSQESGWTKYFNDFFDDHDDINNKEEKVSFPLVDEISSHLSDSSSLQVKNSTNDGRVSCFPTHKNRYNRPICKRKTKGTQFEDALEDTASSPVNSPKEQGSGSKQVNERNDLEFDGRKN